MFARGFAGAVVGALTGLGFLITWRTVAPPPCVPSDPGAHCAGRPLTFMMTFPVWVLVGTLLLAAVLKLVDLPPTWAASGPGCVLWVLLGVPTAASGLLSASGLASVLLPAACFGLAAVFTSLEPSSSADGGPDRDWP